MSGRKEYAATVAVDRPEQLDELVRLAANAEIGLAIEDEAAPTFREVHVINKFNDMDGIYVFDDADDAERFANACRASGADITSTDEPIFATSEDATERLIATERGDALEDEGWPSAAEDVREGADLEVVVARLLGGEPPELCREGDDIIATLREWIAEDAAKSGEVGK